MRKRAIVLLVAAGLVVSVRGQNFTNLNFESAYNLPGNPSNGVPVSVANALPGWIAYGNGVALSSIYYVSNFLGAAANVELESGSLALSGNNLSVGLYAYSSISQTGMVPNNAESLEFEGAVPLASGFSVTLGGQTLSLSTISNGSDYNEYGANIPSSMDGNLEELIFSCEGVGSGGVLLDDIEFMPVPEPSEFALLGVGAVALFTFRRRRSSPLTLT